jgi:hypothetical protein
MQTNENASAGLPCDCVPTDALSQDLMLVIGGSVQNDGLFFFYSALFPNQSYRTHLVLVKAIKFKVNTFVTTNQF